MSKFNLIFIIVCLILISVTMLQHKKVEKSKPVKQNICIYNENPNCYENLCKYCSTISECQTCCGNDCDKCPGHKVIR